MPCGGDDRRWISVPEAARLLEVQVKAARDLIDRGALTVRRLPGRHPRVLRADVDRLLAESTTPARGGGA